MTQTTSNARTLTSPRQLRRRLLTNGITIGEIICFNDWTIERLTNLSYAVKHPQHPKQIFRVRSTTKVFALVDQIMSHVAE